MPGTENQILKQKGRGRASPGPSGQHQNILTRQAIQKSARIERSRLAKDLLDAIRDYGEESPRVATILIGLAKTFSKLENYQKQEEYVKKAVEVNRRNYGDNNHLETAKALHELGNAYFNLKEAEKAKEEYEKALKIIEDLKYSDQVIDVEFAELCNNLGSVCHALEQYQEAEVYFNKALPVFKKIEGAKSFRVATVLGNLGRVYRGLNNHEKSWKSFDEALPIYKDICGNSHIEVGKIFNELGNIYYGLAKKETRNDQKKEYLEQACQYHENAVTIYKKFYGNEDIAVAVVLDNLAGDYRFLGNEEKAEELYTEELEIRQKYLDIQIKNNPDSIETAEEYSNLGDLYRNLGNCEGAIWSYTKELETKKKLYPKGDDISIASPLQGLGVSYYALGDYRNAAEFYKKALAIQEKHLGPDDPITRKTSEVLNELKARESLERLHETLKEKEENYSHDPSFANHLQLGQALRELADAYGVLKDYKNQKIYLEKALSATEETLGDSNSTFTRILKDLANAKAALGASAQEVQVLNERKQKALIKYNQIDPNLPTRSRSKNIIGFDNLFHYIKQREGGLEKIKELVEERSENVNQEDANDGTPLHLASEERKVEIMKYLIGKGAKVNAVNKEGKTPLAVVVEKLHYTNVDDTVLTLLSSGANINNLNSDQKQKLVSHIEEKGLISYAKEKGYDDTVVDMLSSLVFSFGLFYYAKKGDFEGVKRLVEKGVNVNKKDDSGITPLHIAAEKVSITGEKASTADEKVKVEHTKIIEYLLTNKAYPNVQNKEGETPVHVVVNRNTESLKSLLKHGGDPNILNKKGLSPLAKAMEMNHCDRAVVLLRNGANVSDLDHDRQRQNLYSYAKEEGYNDIVTMLAPLVKAPKPKPPVRAVLPMPQEARPPQAHDSTARVSSSYDQELQELQDLCGMTGKCRFLQVPDLTARAPSSQIVHASASEAQVPSPQLVQASVSEAQAHSSSTISPSKKKGCILM